MPLAFDADIAAAHVRWMAEDIGARPYRSEAENRAVAGVEERLIAAGWAVQRIGRNPVACRGAGHTLFLAHVDSVPLSPGAVDNAGSVAVLLELARTTTATDLCLGFPVGEEAGLIGSHQMARGWRTIRPQMPALVVALEFAGDGRPTAVDLNRTWGTAELGWLVEHAPTLDIRYTYRATGRALPQNRSDHSAFEDRGIPSFLLAGRSDIGVFARYHQATDTSVEPNDLARTAVVLEGLSLGGPPSRGADDPALPLFGFVIPGWLTWGLLGAGGASALVDLRRWRAMGAGLWRALVGAGAAAVAMLAVQALGLDSTEPERTAEAVMGVDSTGWWLGAPIGVALGWMVWAVFRWRLGGRGSAPLAAGILAACCTALDPLIALPFAVAAIVARIHPLLAVLPALILLRPTPLRELAFHGLLPPIAWGALWLLTWPAFGARPPKR